VTRRTQTPGSQSSAAPDRATPLLRDRVRGVFKRLPRALAGDEEALHDMRVAARRLRVALPLLARRPEGRRVRRSLKVLKQVTRTAGASRDLDVAVALFAERGADPSAERTVLKRRLRAARGRSRTRMAEALLDLEIAELRRHLRATVSRRADGLFVVLRRLRETRTALGTEVLSLLDALGDRYDPAALHRLRIRTRRLRYMAEMGDAFRGQSTSAADDLKALQDRLGLVQDNHVIAEWFGRQAAAARARGQADLAREAASHRAHFVDASHEHHRAFLAAGPSAVIRRALATMAGSRSAA
jgi:CHAD domain-containing protein